MAEERQCGVEGCEQMHKRSWLMCRRHWLGLPKAMRDEHWRICREEGFFSKEYAESSAACFAHWSSGDD